MLSTVAPTAFAYAGTDPNTKQADPMMNSHAIALFRPTGLTVMPLPSQTALSGVSDEGVGNITPEG
jgi:hypothetical protein